MMDAEGNSPLDISDFRCVAADRSTIVVIFEPTHRHYTYFWYDDELDLSHPEIVGAADPHVPEVIDCLARAVAYKAVQDAGTRPKLRAEPEDRKAIDKIRDWWAQAEFLRSA